MRMRSPTPDSAPRPAPDPQTRWAPGQHQVVAKLRAGADQFGERPDEADLILARLQIAHRKKNGRSSESAGGRRPAPPGATPGGIPRRRRWEPHHFVLVQVAVNRRMARRENSLT